MVLSKKQKKSLDCNLLLVKMESVGVKVENASVWWSRANVNDKIEALEADVDSEAMALTESAQQSATQVAQSMEMASS